MRSEIDGSVLIDRPVLLFPVCPLALYKSQGSQAQTSKYFYYYSLVALRVRLSSVCSGQEYAHKLPIDSDQNGRHNLRVPLKVGSRQ